MRCLSCMAENTATRRFCAECGTLLPLPCPACGFANEPAARFCGGCGKPLSAAAAPARAFGSGAQRPDGAERRQLTVMFCDLVGSTALASRLDPEDLREVIGAYHQCIAETIERYDGFIARYMGDGVMTYFGYPHAHEDDAERAVRAALAVVEAVRRVPGPDLLQVRVGLATGLAIVGDLIGSGAAQELAVIGETPNLASRLQALAGNDEVVIPENTRRLIGNLFDYQSLGEVEVKGLAVPISVFRVIRESPVGSRFEALRTGETPLVGREEELELLVRRWAEARSGAGHVMLVSGEPGIGKSRLAEAFRESLESERHVRLRYFCSPHHQDSALFPFIGQLERACGFERDDTASVRLDKLEMLVAEDVATEDDVPLLAELLSVPLDNRYLAPDLTPQRKKERTFEALLRQLAGLADRRPVLMIVEDLHWADPTSRELLDLTVQQIERLPVLLIATFRPEYQPLWTDQPHVTALSLGRLGRNESGELVRGVLGASAPLSEELIDEIVERTDGVPLFLEELTKAVIEAAVAGPELIAIPSASATVPATLHASLLARLDRLGSTAKEVLQFGAVIGRDFSYELLSAAGQWADKELRSALGRLVAAGLLFQREVPPRASFLFKHALVQDTAYSMLLRGPRRSLHARIAGALEERFPDATRAQPEAVAHHFTEAGLFEKAVEYWRRAGRRSVARSGFVEAITQLRMGLRLIPNLPDTRERKQQELELQIALGGALTVIKGYAHPEVEEAFGRAHSLISETGRVGTVVHFSMLRGLWAAEFVGGKPRAALDRADEFLLLAQSQQDSRVLTTGHWLAGRVLIAIGDFPAATSHLERAVGLYRAEKNWIFDPRLGADPGVTALATWGLSLWHQGYPEQARATVDEALQRARQLRHLHTLAYALLITGLAALSARNTVEAEELGDELAALSDEHRFAFFSGFGQIFQGWAAAPRGQGRAAVQRIREGLAAAEATGWRSHEPAFHGLLAEALALTGAIDEGLSVLAKALATAEASGARGADAELYRLRGDLLRRSPLPEWTEAEGDFRRALTVAQEQGTRGFELRAALSLARLLNEMGRCGEARDCLAPAYGWFTEGFETSDLKAAKALLDELG
jgi:class 3 adenylate cyclase/predicted ATPase